MNDSKEVVFSESHREVAGRFLKAINIKDVLKNVQSITLDSQDMVQFKPELEKFMDKYMSFECLEVDFLEMYMAVFSEDELEDLVAFYNTDLGKKLLDKGPALIEKGLELGQRKVEENQGELEKMLEEKMEKEDL